MTVGKHVAGEKCQTPSSAYERELQSMGVKKKKKGVTFRPHHSHRGLATSAQWQRVATQRTAQTPPFLMSLANLYGLWKPYVDRETEEAEKDLRDVLLAARK